MAELADAADSKSADRKVVGVRPPLPAPQLLNLIAIGTHIRGNLSEIQEAIVHCFSVSVCPLDGFLAKPPILVPSA